MAVKDQFFTWDQAFSIGMDEIDDQHKVLFEIMNKLWLAIVRHQEKDEMAHILADLERYTLSHFTAEETFMKVSGFEGYEAHRQEHQKFIERIAQAREAALIGQVMSLDLLHFLKDWLVHHIQQRDREYASEYLASRKPSFWFKRFFSRLGWSY